MRFGKHALVGTRWLARAKRVRWGVDVRVGHAHALGTREGAFSGFNEHPLVNNIDMCATAV
jgi:hypothetical protein